MAKTTEVRVLTTATRLPDVLDPTRTSVLVENLGPNTIWLSHDPGVTVGEGHQIATNSWRTFGGAPLWAICETDQEGGLAQTTIVTEYP
jgi:CxxC motif-containing protein (DUF1111 family)